MKFKCKKCGYQSYNQSFFKTHKCKNEEISDSGSDSLNSVDIAVAIAVYDSIANSSFQDDNNSDSFSGGGGDFGGGGASGDW